LGNGKVEKTKASLIEDARDKDPEMFPNNSFPTVSSQSDLAVLGIIITCCWSTFFKY
jgi:hypothetical protein